MSDEVQTLYHGTKRGFRKGGILLPCAETGFCSWQDYPHDERSVYATPDPVMAAYFAKNSQGRGKPKVLVIEAHGRVREDRFLLRNEWHLEVLIEWATVIDVHVIEPIVELASIY